MAKDFNEFAEGIDIKEMLKEITYRQIESGNENLDSNQLVAAFSVSLLREYHDWVNS